MRTIIAVIITLILTAAVFWFAIMYVASHTREPAIPLFGAGESLTYSQALIQSRTTGKKIFLYFGGERCSACREMRVLMARDEVKTKLADYLVVLVNCDDDRDLVKQFKVSGIPDYRVLDADEKQLARKVGSCSEFEFIAWLRAAK